MRGRVSVVVLLSLLTAASLFPQCSYTNAFSWPFRASYLDVAVGPAQNLTWAATGYGIEVFTLSTGNMATRLPLPGVTRVVTPSGSGTFAYAGSGSKVVVLAYSVNGFEEGSESNFQVLGSVDAGATVNDIVATPTELYVATSNGLQQYDTLPVAAPARTTAIFATSSQNVTSIAISGSLLYAADGDSMVEIFDITVPNLPQKVGQLQSLPRSIAVHPTSTRVYVSDGQNTDVFLGKGTSAVKVATEPYGTIAFSPLSGDIVFAAGSDRRIHAIDWTNADQPVELYAGDILPTGGSINRPAAFSINGNSLIVAAGDAGLQTYDISAFKAPFAVRSYLASPTSSVIWASGKLYASRTSGGITEFTKSASGALTAARQWESRVFTLQDGNDNGYLLGSTGSQLIFWTLNSATPTPVSSVQFAHNITSAVAVGFSAYVVLDDNSVWQADLSQTSPTPFLLGLNSATSIARAGSTIISSDVLGDGSTVVSRFAQGNPPFVSMVTIPGSATTRVAVSESKAAVFTFRGINIVDFATGSVTVLPQSNTAIALGLAFHGSQLLELTDTALRVWDPATGAVVREFPLPVSGTALAGDDVSGIATPTGVTAVILDSTSVAPRLVAMRGSNDYYKKIAASGDRLYLFDGRTIDIFSMTAGAAPHYVNSVQPPGIVDFAVSPTNVFAISNSRVVTSWSRDGAPLAQATLNEGSDVQPLAMGVAAGAPWVSISKGCLTGSCVKQTLVLDPGSLVRTALLEGGAVDVTSSGTRGWAVFDIPASIRAYDIADPLHPSQLATRTPEGGTTPVSIAEANGTLYVLGDRLYSYEALSLTKTAEQFSSYQPDLSGTFAYVDQRVRIDGGCGFVSGRSASPQLFAVPQWTAAASPTVPASVRSVASVAGRLYLLTDDSVEVWTTQPPSSPSRQRSTR